MNTFNENLSDFFLSQNPTDSFELWFKKAELVEQNAAAMSLATWDHEHQRPTSRFLLYKGMDEGKIIFYTNYLSPKSAAIEYNNEVSLNFYWHISQKQVRVQGRASKMSHADSEKYFHSRDRDSQIASWISKQSSPVENKAELLKRFHEATEQFSGLEVPLPENWGGYLVEPYEFEFFLYGANRLNDRFLYFKKDNQWMIQRLQP